MEISEWMGVVQALEYGQDARRADELIDDEGGGRQEIRDGMIPGACFPAVVRRLEDPEDPGDGKAAEDRPAARVGSTERSTRQDIGSCGPAHERQVVAHHLARLRGL